MRITGDFQLDQRVFVAVFPLNGIPRRSTGTAQPLIVRGKVFKDDRTVTFRMDIFFHVISFFCYFVNWIAKITFFPQSKKGQAAFFWNWRLGEVEHATIGWFPGGTVKEKFTGLEEYGKQLVEAADSIPANIAEGWSRYYKKDKIRFYHYSFGSMQEIRNWVRKDEIRNLIPAEEGRPYPG